MASDAYAIQLGLFGGKGIVHDGAHRVQAHLRNLPGGGTAFVQEHLRWNRGRRAGAPAPAPRKTRPEQAPLDQLALWGAEGPLPGAEGPEHQG